MEKLTFTISILICVLSHSLTAQESWIDAAKHQDLIELKTDYPFKTFVSTDTIYSSNETLKNIANAKSYFDKIFQTDLDFTVMLIEKEKWNQFAYYPPPGNPQAANGNIILGLGKSVVAQMVEGMVNQFPAASLTSLKSAYGENLNLDLFYKETLALHELGHLYHLKQGVNSQRKWLDELFATMAMYADVKHDCNSCYDRMNAYPEFVLNIENRTAEFQTLANFEEMYVQQLPPLNYEWLQMHFYVNAKAIVDATNETVLIKLRDFIIKTDLGKAEKLSDADLAIRLEKEVGIEVAAVMTDWKYK